MSCLQCPVVVAADQLGLGPGSILDDEPALGLLCTTHVKEFFDARRRRDNKAIWPRCVCGNEMYLDRPDLCSRCHYALARRGRTIDVNTTVHPVALRKRWVDDVSPPLLEVEAEPPIMPSRICPEDQLPRGIAPLLKRAGAAGWTTRATVAIAGDGTRSVVCRYRRDGIVIVTSHEGAPDGSGMSFKFAWWTSPGVLQPLGYRQVGPAIDAGEPPEDVDKDEQKAIVTLGKAFRLGPLPTL